MTEGFRRRRSECRGAISKVDKVGAQRGRGEALSEREGGKRGDKQGMGRGQAEPVPSSPPGKDGPRDDKLLKNLRNSYPVTPEC